MKQSIVYIGIDVAKAHLDVAWQEQSRRFANDKCGQAALIKWLKQSAFPVQLICEASGGYEQALVESLEHTDITASVVQANRVRQYARAAAILLAQMPELGQLNRRQAAALGGLAPFNRESGTLRGKRTIFGGRRALRSGLYMAAMVAARRNPILCSFYQRLRAKGKPHKLALTAVMRKLLLVLNQNLKPIT